MSNQPPPSSPGPMRRIAILAVAAFTLAACGGDDDGDGAPPLEDAVRAYSDAVLGGDPTTGRSLLSSRCQDSFSADEFAGVVAQLTDRWGDAEMTSYADSIDGQLATATYSYDAPAIDQAGERWVLEDGEWRNDDCPR